MFKATKQVGENALQAKGTVIASLAALGSVVLASSCCLPLLPFLFAAGAAGTSAFFVKIRPFLLAASLLFIAFGFYQAWRAKKCNCKPTVLSTILLWFSAAVVVAFILFPQAIANFIANLVGVDMRRGSIIFAGPAAIAVMVFYYFIPFLIVAGAPDSFAKLRPFVITASVLLIAFGFLQSWRAHGSAALVSKHTLPVFWFSALVVLGLILFPQPIANFLANALGG